MFLKIDIEISSINSRTLPSPMTIPSVVKLTALLDTRLLLRNRHSQQSSSILFNAAIMGKQIENTGGGGLALIKFQVYQDEVKKYCS